MSGFGFALFWDVKVIAAKSGAVKRDVKHCRNWEGACLREENLGRWVC